MKTVRSNWLSRLGIVVIAALLVAAISIVQYQRLSQLTWFSTPHSRTGTVAQGCRPITFGPLAREAGCLIV